MMATQLSAPRLPQRSIHFPFPKRGLRGCHLPCAPPSKHQPHLSICERTGSAPCRREMMPRAVLLGNMLPASPAAKGSQPALMWQWREEWLYVSTGFLPCSRSQIPITPGSDHHPPTQEKQAIPRCHLTADSRPGNPWSSIKKKLRQPRESFLF